MPDLLPPDNSEPPYKALLANGVNRADATRLATTCPEECRRQLAHLPFVKEFKSTKGAWLRSAIEGKYEPPKGYEEAQRAKEDAANAIAQSKLREQREQEARERRKAADAQYETLLETIQANTDQWQAVQDEAWLSLDDAVRDMLTMNPNHGLGNTAYKNAIRKVVVRDYSLQNNSASVPTE